MEAALIATAATATIKPAITTAINMKAILASALCVFALLASSPVLSWDGYDYERGGFVEIEKGNLVRPGRDIDFYDGATGEYRTGEVQSIRRSGRTVEVEIQDFETGEIRTFDMDN